MEDEFDTEEQTGEQAQRRQPPTEHLKPWQYKKGQSGNPSGRAKGISLKEYVKVKFNQMTDEEREEFLHGLDKETIWKQAEGNPENKTDVTSGGEKIVLDAKSLEIARKYEEELKNTL